MLAIYTAGDYLWRIMSFRSSGKARTRLFAMEDTAIKKVMRDSFFRRLSDDSLFKGFVQYLAVRLADQQQLIANLVTVDSEHRLGETLLQWLADGQERSAQYQDRAANYPRGVIDNGWNDAPQDQSLYAAIQESGIDRDQRRASYDRLKSRKLTDYLRTLSAT